MHLYMSKQGAALLSWVMANFLMPIVAFAMILSIEETSRYFFFILFILILFMPELALLISKGFRLWIKDGIEDNDQKFNITDFATMMVHYSMLWCVRVFVVSFLVEIFFNYHVREIYILSSFAGAFGIEVVGAMIKKKKE